MLSKSFDHANVEPALYAGWEGQGAFHAGQAEPDGAAPGAPYTIMIPPPNVTGSLHMGHALTMTLQDTLIRWRRMQGRDALWQPGTDHAGIATQMVVERLLPQEGNETRQQMGRERLPRARLAVEGRKRRRHHQPAAHAGRLARLAARALHHGRRAQRRRAARCS